MRELPDTKYKKQKKRSLSGEQKAVLGDPVAFIKRRKPAASPTEIFFSKNFLEHLNKNIKTLPENFQNLLLLSLLTLCLN